MSYASTANPSSTPNWLCIVSAIGVIWYIFGFVQFVLGVTMDVPAAVTSGAITKAHGAAITATPALVWAAYAAACLLGIAGAIQLFRGQSAAILFALSLVSAVIYFGWVHILSGTGADRPPEEPIIAIVVIVVTAVFAALSLRKS